MTNGRGCEWHFLALLSVEGKTVIQKNDDVTVYADGTLTYGVTTRSNPTYNGSWFSACDFTVERIGD